MRKKHHSEIESDDSAWTIEGTAEDGHVTATVTGASMVDGTVGLEVRLDGDERHLRMLEGIVAELLTSLLGAPRSRSLTAYRMATIRQRLPRAYLPWTEADEQLLLERYDAGDTVDQVAERLQRGSGGVRSRLVKLGRIQEAG